MESRRYLARWSTTKRAASRSSTTTRSTTCSRTCSRSRRNRSPTRRCARARTSSTCSEILRAEGTSPWFAADHDESALILDGEIEVHFVKPDQAAVPAGKEGTVKLAGEPKGKKMGWVKCAAAIRRCCRRAPPISSASRRQARRDLLADDHGRRTRSRSGRKSARRSRILVSDNVEHLKEISR